jgi:hypothetical protein
VEIQINGNTDRWHNPQIVAVATGGLQGRSSESPQLEHERTPLVDARFRNSMASLCCLSRFLGSSADPLSLANCFMDPTERLADIDALSECRQQVDNVAIS